MPAEQAVPSTEQAAFDAHGIEPVPPEHRTSSAMDQFWIWAGANIAPINWVLGTLGITFGLSLIETVLVIAIGNAFGCVLFAFFNLMGHRTGVNQMVLSRLTFGRRGAYIPAAAQVLMPMGWVGVNTWIVLDLATGALDKLGIGGGGALVYVVAFVIMAIQVAIAVWGFYAIRTFERFTMPIVGLIMLLMTVVALTQVDIQLTGGTATGGDKVTAITQLMTAIGIGWGISWMVYASDYSRFTRPSVSDRKLLLATGAGMFIPTVWLASLGAAIASAGGATDPSSLVITTFGAMALPVLLLLLHGPIATNIVVIYSSALAVLTMDIKVARWKVSLGAGVVGSAVLLAFIQSDSFALAFDQWMVSMIVWISPWVGITLVDFYLRHRSKVDVAELYKSPSTSRYGDFKWAAIIALACGLVAGWAWQFGLVEAFQGPLAKSIGNTDLSWLMGMTVGAGVYLGLAKRRTTRGRAPVAAPG